MNAQTINVARSLGRKWGFSGHPMLNPDDLTAELLEVLSVLVGRGDDPRVWRHRAWQRTVDLRRKYSLSLRRGGGVQVESDYDDVIIEGGQEAYARSVEISRAIESMDPQSSTVLRLYIQGHKISEIMAQAGLSRQVVRTIVRKFKDKNGEQNGEH